MKNELLLYSMGIKPDQEFLRKGLDDSDWDEIIQQSLFHGISALLYRNIKKNGLASFIPDTVLQKLRSIYLSNVMRNLRLYNEFSKISRSLNENNVPFIVMKGVALAELIYKDIALRPMADIDLIIKTQDIWKTDRIFESLGYKSDIKSFVSRHHVQWANNIHYFKTVPVDIHPVTYNLPNVDPWIKARSAKINSDDVLILGPEDSLLHLCLHLNNHFHTKNLRLIWWCDIVELLRTYQNNLDWNYFISISKRSKAEGFIYRILNALINEIPGVNIPNIVFDQLNSNEANISIRDVLTISSDPECRRGQVRPGDLHIRQTMLFVLKVPSILGKINLIFRIMFPCKDFVINHYTPTRPNRVYFYYPIHLLNVIVNAFRSLSYIPSYLKDKQSFLNKIENLDNLQQVL